MADTTTQKKKINRSGGREIHGVGTDHLTVVNEVIHVGQLNVGNKNVSKWHTALKSALSLTNPRRKALVEIIEDITTSDLHLDAVLNKRTGAITTQPFEWMDLDSEQIIENFESPWFHELLTLIMDYRYQGHTVIQIAVDGLIHDVEMIPRQNIIPEKKLVTWEMFGEDGFRYDEDPFDRYVLEMGKPKDFGLLSKAAPYVLMKRDNLAFFMTHNEIFGMPLRVYYYDPNDATARQKTVESAEKQGAAAYIVLPESSRVDFEQANSASAANNPYQVLHRIINEEISIGILGQTLTTSTEGKGSNALGRIHKDVEEAINLQDMLFVEMILNYKFRRLAILHGYPLDGIKGQFLKTQRLSQEEKLNIWDKIGQHHAPIDFEAWYDEFNVPHPEDQESIGRFLQRGESGNPETGGMDLKTRLDAYGVAVRAGAVTPQVEDEEFFRDQLGLPEQNESARDAWDKDGGVRRPITLKPQEIIEEEIREAESSNQKKKINARIRAYYRGLKSGKKSAQISADFHDDLDRVLERITADLHAGTIRPGDVDEELYRMLGDRLYGGVQEGFGSGLASLGENTPDREMLAALRENIYVFSGFKTYQGLRAASDMLLDDAGRVRAFDEFRQAIAGIHRDYYQNWLRTEYNMAIANSQAASRWLRIEQDRDTLPLLRYRAVRDERVRHLQYDGITAPVDAPVWDRLTPPIDWGCRCTLQQLADGEPTPVNELPEDGLIRNEFAFNPGKQKIVFPQNHPYYEVMARDQDASDELFGLEIPPEDG